MVIFPSYVSHNQSVYPVETNWSPQERSPQRVVFRLLDMVFSQGSKATDEKSSPWRIPWAPRIPGEVEAEKWREK